MPAPSSIHPSDSPPRVLVFGFSVSALSEAHDYVAFLAHALGEEAVVARKAIGAAGLPLVPYLHALLDYASHDYVVFEVATCHRFADATPDAYDTLLLEIGGHCRAMGAMPVFLNLARGGIASASDPYLCRIRAVCASRHWPLLDLTGEVDSEGRAAAGVQLLRDGTHPGPEGARMYGERLAAFLRTLFRQQPWRNPGGPGPATPFTLLPATSFGPATARFEYAGVAMDCLELEADRPHDIRLPAGHGLRGLLYVMGPRTGAFQVGVGTATHNVVAYDAFCYYERLAYTLRWTGALRSLAVRAMPERPAVRLRKGEPDPRPPVTLLAGVLAQRC